MNDLFELGLYSKLAELILLQDPSQGQFLFTEKGSLKAEIGKRLGEEFNQRFRTIL